MGANEEMMSLAESYGRLFIISCVIGTLNVSMSNIIVSQGASKTSASAMIIGSVINVALDPLFIYAFGWGVEGAAWATILSRIITTIIYTCFFMKAEVKVSFALFVPTIRMYLDIIKIGISMLCLQLLQTLSISLLQRAAVKYGAEAVAAVGIVLKIVTLGTNVVFGFVKGLQPMAGYNYGAENFQRLKEAVRCSLILTTSFCVLWSTFILVFASPVISCFGKDETMQEIARIALRANTLMFFTFGFQFVYSTLYMAIGRARQSLLLNIGRQGLFFIPVILLTAKSQIESQIEGIELGADAYLTKPFDVKLLKTNVRNLLNKSKQHTPIENIRQKVIDKKQQEQLDKLTHLVVTNMQNPHFSVDNLCLELGMNRTKLYSFAKQATELTLANYIRKIRLDKAAELLKTTDKLISEVCYEVGIDSPSYFTRAFKEQFGVSPSEFISGKR